MPRYRRQGLFRPRQCLACPSVPSGRQIVGVLGVSGRHGRRIAKDAMTRDVARLGVLLPN